MAGCICCIFLPLRGSLSKQNKKDVCGVLWRLLWASERFWIRAGPPGGINSWSHSGFFSDLKPTGGELRDKLMICGADLRFRGCSCSVMLNGDWSWRGNLLYFMNNVTDRRGGKEVRAYSWCEYSALVTQINNCLCNHACFTVDVHTINQPPMPVVYLMRLRHECSHLK